MTLRIKVDKVEDSGTWFDFQEKPEAFPVIADMIKTKECIFTAPISIHLKGTRIGEIIEVEGNIETCVRLACSRCLNEFETTLESRFDLTFTPEASAIEDEFIEEELELKPEDLALIHYRGEEIDLREEIQQQVVMAFPLRFVCQEECRGLCQHCGANLNEEDCKCDPVSAGNKFAILKNLKLDKKKKPTGSSGT
jgi:uncharacterized protein